MSVPHISQPLYAFMGDTFLSSSFTTGRSDNQYLEDLPIGTTLVKKLLSGEYSVFVRIDNTGRQTTTNKFALVQSKVTISNMPVSGVVKAYIMLTP